MRCDPFQVEALAFGVLAPIEAAAVEAHLEGCVACARELKLLREEHAVLASPRAAVQVPDFEQVFAAALAPAAMPFTRRVVPRLAAAVATAAAVAVLLSRGSAPVEQSGGACWAPEPALSVEMAQSSEESLFGECLLASPAPDCV